MILVLFVFFHPLILASRGVRSTEVPNDGRPVDFSGYSLIEAIPNSPENVDFLKYLDATVDEEAMDFWSDPRKDDLPVEVLVHPEIKKMTQELFQERNMTVNIITNNFTEMIEKEKLELDIEEQQFFFKIRTSEEQYKGTYLFDFFTYNTLDSINEYLAHLSENTANYNSLDSLNVQLKSIGTTYERRPINMVSISLNDGKRKSAIWLDCGIHSREKISPAFCLYAIDQLVHNSGGILKNYDFYIVPIVNPDGYVYMNSVSRNWRKNRTPNAQRKSASVIRSERQFGWGQQFQGVLQGYPGIPQSATMQGGFPAASSGAASFGGFGSHNKCTGTDLNRNFDMDWATVGSSSDPCQDTYHGSSPFSEVESRAVRDAIYEIQSTKTIAAFVTVHAYSQLWMTPYGSKKSLSPHNQDLKRVAQKASAALFNVHGTKYEYGPISHIIYLAAGSSVDWAHSKAGIKYSYGLELRPGRDLGFHGFMLPVNQIKPTVDETWVGITEMCSEIEKEFPANPGQLIQSVP